MKHIKAILINVVDKTVTEVELNHSDESSNGLAEIYKLLNCTCITAAEAYIFTPLEHALFVDDEGLLKDQPDGAFQIGSGQVLSGNGLIVGIDEEGATISHNMIIEKFKEKVTFRDVADLPEPSFEIYSW